MHESLVSEATLHNASSEHIHLHWKLKTQVARTRETMKMVKQQYIFKAFITAIHTWVACRSQEPLSQNFLFPAHSRGLAQEDLLQCKGMVVQESSRLVL